MHDYPTVLVAHDDEGVCGTLGNCLRREGYNVLEAHQWTTVCDLIRVHSRPIHLILADVSITSRMPILEGHGAELQVVFVRKPVDADEVLANVRQLLGSPPSPSLIS
jgi:DNA-binding NtrC family response regulator